MFKKIALCSLAAAICTVGSSAFAHTVIRDEGTSGKALWSAFVTTHGCAAGETGTPIPVRAQSAVFPFGPQVANASAGPGVLATAFNSKSGKPTGKAVNLAKVIKDWNPAVGINFGVAGIQSNEVFSKTDEKSVDVPFGHSKTSVVALQFRNGELPTNLYGYAPFRATMPEILPKSCVKSLKVHVAIGNWCTTSADSKHDNRADIWIGRLTPKFNDEGVTSIDYWPTLTVNRDASNPLPRTCNATNTIDVALEPSDESIDTDLPLKGFWPANAP